ncbi:hypothetical protein PREVCOP_04190 [Segatella copri DSM 18205]|uniref:Uncharacterized protein n=1 Tax=Segatella copri DSM 18205 TaxID=537011 RepID=D1PAG5_9BACT|nr:hypothetical protein PREVCOP_04190 [Segatella copri DSM 18205]
MQATMSPCKGKSFKKPKAFAFAGRLYFILREMTHDEPASETQHQYDAARQNRISRRELYEKGSNML